MSKKPTTLTVRCHRCDVVFSADPGLVDTQCPDCGGSSFVPVRNR